MKKTFKTAKRKLFIYLGLAFAVILGVFLYFQSIKQTAQVAEIAGSNCPSNLATFQANSSYNNDSFTQYTYSCKNALSAIKVMSESCLNFNTAYTKALADCGQNCGGAVSETAVPRPTSTPTPTPRPSIMASVMPSPVASATPRASCLPRPACLDADRPCKIADKPGMYCTTSTPTPTPTPQPTITPKPRDQWCFTIFNRTFCRNVRFFTRER